jgi:hypothetical protein
MPVVLLGKKSLSTGPACCTPSFAEIVQYEAYKTP